MSTVNDRSPVLILLVMLLVSAIVITLWEGWKFNSEKSIVDRLRSSEKSAFDDVCLPRAPWTFSSRRGALILIEILWSCNGSTTLSHLQSCSFPDTASLPMTIARSIDGGLINIEGSGDDPTIVLTEKGVEIFRSTVTSLVNEVRET